MAIPHFISREKNSTRFTETKQETWSQYPDLARNWALTVVEETVTRKVEGDVYPILLGAPDSYQPGWGFRSLLGAMWLQIRTFMLGSNNLCPQCGRLFRKRRRDMTHCGEACAGRARARRQYVKKKQRQQEPREATRRRLRK
jgi:hypothetical protein